MELVFTRDIPLAAPKEGIRWSRGQLADYPRSTWTSIVAGLRNQLRNPKLELKDVAVSSDQFVPAQSAKKVN